MASGRGLCCLISGSGSQHPDDADATARGGRRGAACICCIGPHHKPGGGKCGPCLTPKLDLSVKTPLVSCCGSGGGGSNRGRSGTRTPRTPKTPCTPSARRLCGVRSRTPRPGQVCCFPTPQGAASAAGAESARTPRTPRTPLGARGQHTCCVRAAQGRAKLGRPRRWLRSMSRTLAQPPCRTARAVFRANVTPGTNGDVKIYDPRLAEAEAAAAALKEDISANDEYSLLCREGFAREDVAAVTIQAYFRGHLARRAFKALKSLVRLQAVARGVHVRQQAEAAVHCMQALVRLQVRVRARQLLTKSKDAPQLLHS